MLSKERYKEELVASENHIHALTKDLVKLAIKTNKVVIKGNFPGAISDEVNELLLMCQEINRLYVKECADEE